MKSRSVAFLDYDLPDLKTTDHMAVLGTDKGAWFDDPEGNILCLHENRTSASAVSPVLCLRRDRGPPPRYRRQH